MRNINEYFLISETFNDIIEVQFEENSFLLHSEGTEDRASIAASFSSFHVGVKLPHLEEISGESFSIEWDGFKKVFNLRSHADSDEFTSIFETKSVYLDFTGLSHSTWAWILRALFKRKEGKLWAIYSEPAEYKFNPSPLEGQMFDLSDKIKGIAPLPGFAKLNDYSNDEFVFMPLLGFEGTRLAHIIENVQPSRKVTYPVIGVPGFEYDFPFYTYDGNRLSLEREGIWKNYRYEKANCPYSIFVLGVGLLTEHPKLNLRIAPIGTKPHALGAVLLRLAFPDRVDLIYDHPVRKPGRTKGKSKTLCFWLNPFSPLVNSSK